MWCIFLYKQYIVYSICALRYLMVLVYVICPCNIFCKCIECLIRHKYSNYLDKNLDLIAAQTHAHTTSISKL
jgi:hypothetical protein